MSSEKEIVVRIRWLLWAMMWQTLFGTPPCLPLWQLIFLGTETGYLITVSLRFFSFLLLPFTCFWGFRPSPPSCLYFSLFFNNTTYWKGGRGWGSGCQPSWDASVSPWYLTFLLPYQKKDKKNIFLFKKTTHLVINLKNECTDTLKYIGCTI